MPLLSIRTPLSPTNLLSSTLSTALLILGLTLGCLLFKPTLVATSSRLVRSYLLSEVTHSLQAIIHVCTFYYVILFVQKAWKESSQENNMSDDSVVQFCNITGSTVQDARRFIQKFKRVDIAIDAYYNNPHQFISSPAPSTAPSPNKLKTLFDKYAESSTNIIAADGTIRFCEDLGVDPEDPVLLALAYELKSGKLGEWNKQGWVDGWKNLSADSIPAMKTAITRLSNQFGSDLSYFRVVYKQTFAIVIAIQEGQRSLGLDMAQAYWSLLIPYGLQGGAVSGGWKDDYTEWWFEFLTEKKVKGISKDTWNMFLDFICSIDSTFSNHDIEGAWPSLIDEFVDYAKERLNT